MLYLMANNALMLEHISSGNLINESRFVHPRRTLDHFVILVGKKGTMHITQNHIPHQLGPDRYLLLYPHCEHYGHLPSEGEVSYHWCHFRVRSAYQMLDDNSIRQHLFLMQNDNSQDNLHNVYIIPEHGNIAAAERTRLIFHQLLDLAMRDSYSTHMVDCALSMLGMEITQNYMDEVKRRSKQERSKTQSGMAAIMEWVRVHSASELSVQQVAENFNYNADYLSTAFRKATGYSLLRYIHHTRIAASKRLLLDSSMSVKEIAGRCGFKDEKHYMKLFKQLEDVTPSQFRNAYIQAKMNNA